MARDRANVFTNIWADSDWRALSESAQRLYLLLLTHPTLTYAGVADWRTNRLSMMSADGSVEKLEAAAAELEDRKFIVVDEGTEEVLIRSFVKHDGLLKSPNLAAALAREYANVYSPRLREVVAFEVQKLHRREPDLKGWDRLGTLLSEPARNVFDEGSSDPSPNPSGNPSLNPSPNPSVNPSGNPSVKGLPNPSINPSPTSTSTSTSNKLESPPKNRKRDLPEGWAPNEAHAKKAKEVGADVAFEAGQFTDYHLARGNKFVDWNRAFSNWLGNIKKFTGPQQAHAKQQASLWTREGPF